MSERQELLAADRVETLRRLISRAERELKESDDPAVKADIEKNLEDLNERFDRAVNSPSY
ncbi:hypothetical protein [Pseudomonas syringae]|uniref:hypothetical protein n=1 Tax=Pseudomonas syringae TaxID=317 RepID=UPI0015D2F998|nr:hypothetical protein [Pseudomonas syringae]